MNPWTNPTVKMATLWPKGKAGHDSNVTSTYKQPMSQLSRILLSVMVALLISASPVLAQFEEGVDALRAGDYAKAMQAWQAGAAAGDARAEYSLGYLYQFGLGVPGDLGKAKEWYEKAAAANNADALYALGLLYESGKAGRRDLAQAMAYYRKAAAAATEPDAEYAIGRMILRGRGVPRDPTEAIRWLSKAAGHHQPAAEYMLGAAYEAGWGVRPDKAEAYYWYRRAQEGDPAELEEQDMAFEPKIAIESLRRNLSRQTIAEIELRLRREEPAAKPEKPTAPRHGPASAETKNGAPKAEKPTPQRAKAARLESTGKNDAGHPAPMPPTVSSVDADGLPKDALTTQP